MAGIYIHIPFCKQACHYCNFHFSTSLKQKDRMLSAILKEIEIQKDYLDGEKIRTIYLGGGTPSLLKRKEIESILETIGKFHEIDKNTEFTLEANPDDLSKKKLIELAETPINRLSIGIQSFFDEDLKFMNRAHNAAEANDAILFAKELGFHDISIDLIYGSPTTSHEMWEKNLEKTFGFGIPHISSYCMTVEPGTALDHFVKKGKAEAVDEIKSAKQFNMLMDAAAKHDYEHYEISNFSKKDRYSKHNTAYWQGKKYLGLGPSAHSFNGHSRQWNIAHNAKYMNGVLDENKLLHEKEILSPANIYNEYIMTSLRTQWGTKLEQIDPFFHSYFLEKSKTFIASKKLIHEDGNFRLTQKGKMIADRIAMEMFWAEE